jgi:cytochrome c oxidase cbb3-type subunit 3
MALAHAALASPQQAPPSTPAANVGRGGRGPTSAYPVRQPADPATVDRGKQLFGVNCSFCHGPDARGGEGGPNLLRSQVALDDQNGEAIAVVVQNGRADRGMPKFDMSLADVQAIAAFIHSFPLRGSGVVPQSAVVVGDPKAGEAFFNGPGKCASCHSVTGDLAGIGAKYDARTLETRIMMPGRGRGATPAQLPPTTVKVTSPAGQVVEGTLNRIDDFAVSLTDAQGNRHTFSRNGDSPKVQVNDPLQAHKAIWQVINDDEIHNLTAYLAAAK